MQDDGGRSEYDEVDSFEVHSYFNSEGEGVSLRGHCVVSGRLTSHNDREAAEITVAVDDDSGGRFEQSYIFFDDGDGLLSWIPPIPDPVAAYLLCVGGRVAGSVARAAYRCYSRDRPWSAFLACMKGQASGLGMGALYALFVCLRKLVMP
jgi:hypothetical protein